VLPSSLTVISPCNSITSKNTRILLNATMRTPDIAYF
jgi:hypothetical protein